MLRKYGDTGHVGQFRPIGIERTCFLSLHQNKEEKIKDLECITWLAFGSNVFNALIPLFSSVGKIPAYFSTTRKEVSTDSFYWNNRLIGALAMLPTPSAVSTWSAIRTLYKPSAIS